MDVVEVALTAGSNAIELAGLGAEVDETKGRCRCWKPSPSTALFISMILLTYDVVSDVFLGYQALMKGEPSESDGSTTYYECKNPGLDWCSAQMDSIDTWSSCNSGSDYCTCDIEFPSSTCNVTDSSCYYFIEDGQMRRNTSFWDSYLESSYNWCSFPFPLQEGSAIGWDLSFSLYINDCECRSMVTFFNSAKENLGTYNYNYNNFWYLPPNVSQQINSVELNMECQSSGPEWCSKEDEHFKLYQNELMKLRERNEDPCQCQKYTVGYNIRPGLTGFWYSSWEFYDLYCDCFSVDSNSDGRSPIAVWYFTILLLGIMTLRESIRLIFVLYNLIMTKAVDSVRFPKWIAESPFVILLRVFHPTKWHEMANLKVSDGLSSSKAMLVNLFTEDLLSMALDIIVLRNPILNGSVEGTSATTRAIAIASLVASCFIICYNIFLIRTSGKKRETNEESEHPPENSRGTLFTSHNVLQALAFMVLCFDISSDILLSTSVGFGEDLRFLGGNYLYAIDGDRDDGWHHFPFVLLPLALLGIVCAREFMSLLGVFRALLSDTITYPILAAESPLSFIMISIFKPHLLNGLMRLPIQEPSIIQDKIGLIVLTEDLLSITLSIIILMQSKCGAILHVDDDDFFFDDSYKDATFNSCLLVAYLSLASSILMVLMGAFRIYCATKWKKKDLRRANSNDEGSSNNVNSVQNGDSYKPPKRLRVSYCHMLQFLSAIAYSIHVAADIFTSITLAQKTWFGRHAVNTSISILAPVLLCLVSGQQGFTFLCVLRNLFSSHNKINYPIVLAESPLSFLCFYIFKPTFFQQLTVLPFSVVKDKIIFNFFAEDCWSIALSIMLLECPGSNDCQYSVPWSVYVQLPAAAASIALSVLHLFWVYRSQAPMLVIESSKPAIQLQPSVTHGEGGTSNTQVPRKDYGDARSSTAFTIEETDVTARASADENIPELSTTRPWSPGRILADRSITKLSERSLHQNPDNACSPIWMEYTDPKSDDKYYADESGNTTWERPTRGRIVTQNRPNEEPTTDSIWMEYTDPESDDKYYADESGNTTWEKPTRGRIVTQRRTKSGPTTDSIWMEYTDPESDYKYYANESGNTTWEKPTRGRIVKQKRPKEEPTTVSIWMEYTDPESDDKCYADELGNTTWEKPTMGRIVTKKRPKEEPTAWIE